MTNTRQLQLASGWVLTEEIPDNFNEWEDIRKKRFLKQHVTEDYQHLDGKGIWDEIIILYGFIGYVLKEERDGV